MFWCEERCLSLLGSDCILRGLGDAELYNGLSLDLNRFAGLRVPSHAGLALRLYQTTQSGDDEYTVLLGLFHCGFSEQLEKCRRLFVCEFKLLGHTADEGCFGHACCHEVLLLD